MNIYAYSMGYVNGYQPWGMYHWMNQQRSRGDGSDGRLNNLLTLARPACPTPRPPTSTWT